MAQAAKAPRHNRTLTVDCHDEATYSQLLGDTKAFIEFVLAFILSIGFQLTHKSTCTGGGSLTRHSHYVRIRLGGLTIWRIQCTRCKAVFTVLPHFVLRYRQMRPDVARDALLATHGGLSLERCAVIWHISPMALSRLVCAFGQHSVVTVLTRCGLPLPPYFIADEKHSRCLTAKVYLPASITASATFGHSASPDNVTCWHIMALQGAIKVYVKYFDNFSSPQPIAFQSFTNALLFQWLARKVRKSNSYKYKIFHYDLK